MYKCKPALSNKILVGRGSTRWRQLNFNKPSTQKSQARPIVNTSNLEHSSQHAKVSELVGELTSLNFGDDPFSYKEAVHQRLMLCALSLILKQS